MHPAEIRLTRNKRSLKLVYDDGTVDLTAFSLWKHCRSALALRAELQNSDRSPPATLKIEKIEQIGCYGLNITFSDGNSRGIYPWAYLRELAEAKVEETLKQSVSSTSFEERI